MPFEMFSNEHLYMMDLLAVFGNVQKRLTGNFVPVLLHSLTFSFLDVKHILQFLQSRAIRSPTISSLKLYALSTTSILSRLQMGKSLENGLDFAFWIVMGMLARLLVLVALS